MALKIAVERNSCLRQFWRFPQQFSNYCNKTLILLLLWIFDKLETCLNVVTSGRISLVCFFSKKTETKIVIYAWFDQHLNSSIKVVMHSEWYKNCTMWQKIAVTAAMIHCILFSLYSNCNCRDKIWALTPRISDKYDRVHFLQQSFTVTPFCLPSNPSDNEQTFVSNPNPEIFIYTAICIQAQTANFFACFVLCLKWGVYRWKRKCIHSSCDVLQCKAFGYFWRNCHVLMCLNSCAFQYL
jgi:hypothetical protein